MANSNSIDLRQVSGRWTPRGSLRVWRKDTRVTTDILRKRPRSHRCLGRTKKRQRAHTVHPGIPISRMGSGNRQQVRSRSRVPPSPLGLLCHAGALPCVRPAIFTQHRFQHNPAMCEHHPSQWPSADIPRRRQRASKGTTQARPTTCHPSQAIAEVFTLR